MFRVFVMASLAFALMACANKDAPPAPTTDEFSYTQPEVAPSNDATETAARM